MVYWNGVAVKVNGCRQWLWQSGDKSHFIAEKFQLLSMPDSSPHSRTHLGNFCTMSIWFLLPLNLPVSDPEKVQVKNRGKKPRWWTKQKESDWETKSHFLFLPPQPRKYGFEQYKQI